MGSAGEGKMEVQLLVEQQEQGCCRLEFGVLWRLGGGGTGAGLGAEEGVELELRGEADFQLAGGGLWAEPESVPTL